MPADVGAFLQAYRTVLPFTAKDTNRIVMNGVFWHEEAHALAATDGRRLTVLNLDGLSLGQDFILPASKLLANGVLDGSQGTLGIAKVEDRAYLDLTCGLWHYQGRGVDGEYPNYRMVIPADAGQFSATVEIAPADLPLLRSAIRRLMGEANASVHLCAVPNGAPLLVSDVADAEGNRGQALLANSRCQTEVLQIQPVNGDFLLECLEAGFLTLRLPPDCSPWLCSGERAGLHCLMPMRDDTNQVAALVAASLNPGGTPMSAKTQTIPESGNAADTGTPGALDTAGTATAPDNEGAPGTTASGSVLIIIPADPLQDLRDTLAEAEAALRQATTTLRQLRDGVRAVDRFIREREKQYARSEKVLGQLKLVAGF